MVVSDGEEAGDSAYSEQSQIIPNVYFIKPQGDLKPQQADLEKTFVKIISAPDPYPAPGRAIRNLVGRSLITLYTRCETRTLFDTLQSFLRIVGDLKTNEREVVKMCVVYKLMVAKR